jgi:hypothetical protein
VSAETRAVGASILLAVDGLFLGALLFIHVSARNGYVSRLRDLGVDGPGWPDAGGAPGAALPWAAAAAVTLAAILLRLRLPPVAPLFGIAAAIACTVLALRRMADTGATFGSGRYGTLATVLALVWIAHLAGATVALGRGKSPWRFVALQAIYGIGLAALVFPG